MIKPAALAREERGPDATLANKRKDFGVSNIGAERFVASNAGEQREENGEQKATAHP